MEKLFQARMPVNFSIVSQRRVFAPKGMEGGGDGARGRNTWFKRTRVERERDSAGEVGGESLVKRDGALVGHGQEEEDAEAEDRWEEIMVPSNGIAALAAGDRVRISTPGGGGWGKPE